MPLATALLLPIVLGLVLALAFGLAAKRLLLPTPVGYVLAGAAAGALAAGIPERATVAAGLGEVGLVLAMFGLGLTVSPAALRKVRLSLVPAALLVGVGTGALGLVIALVMGWPTDAGLLFGLALAAPALLTLPAEGEARHWGIVTSLVLVLALLLLPALAAPSAGPHDPFVGVFERFSGLGANGWAVAAIVVVKLAAFIGFMLVVGRRVAPWGLALVTAIGGRELTRLAVAALALLLAVGAAYLFGAHLALGAFLAGMILAEEAHVHGAARAVLPLREAFAAPFFVGIGMLAALTFPAAPPLALIGTLLVILVGRPVLTLLSGALTRQPLDMLTPVAARLAQIGEFAFLIALAGASLGLLPSAGRDLVVIGIALSLVVNPALVGLASLGRARRPGIVLPDRVEPALVEAAPPPAPVEVEIVAPVAPAPSRAMPAGPATLPGVPYRMAGK